MSESTRINQGDIVVHYKSFYNTEEDKKNNKYMYQVLSTEAYTAVDDPVRYVIYKALYGEKKIWLRPYDEFMSEINIEGNPFKYRFNKVEEENHINSDYWYEKVRDYGNNARDYGYNAPLSGQMINHTHDKSTNNIGINMDSFLYWNR